MVPGDEEPSVTWAGNIPEDIKESEHYQGYLRELNDRGFQIDGWDLQRQRNQEGVVVSFSLTNEEPRSYAEIVFLIAESHIIFSAASLHQYRNEEQSKFEHFEYNENSDRVQSYGTVASQTIGNSSGIPCNLCKILYKEGKTIVQSGVRTKNKLTPAFLLSQAIVKIRSSFSSTTKAIQIAGARDVVKYVRTQGVGANSTTACQSIGPCP